MSTEGMAPNLALEALEALERVGCQFYMCTGPTLEPEDMVTCFACITVAKLRTLLGMEVHKHERHL